MNARFFKHGSPRHAHIHAFTQTFHWKRSLERTLLTPTWMWHKYLGGLSRSDGRMEHETDRLKAAAAVEVKKDLSPKAKPSYSHFWFEELACDSNDPIRTAKPLETQLKLDRFKTSTFLLINKYKTNQKLSGQNYGWRPTTTGPSHSTLKAEISGTISQFTTSTGLIRVGSKEPCPRQKKIKNQ